MVKNKEKIWAIGDLHGHYWELTRLWKKLLKAGLDIDQDTIVFLGDYVDGGPDTRKVVNWLIKMEKKCKNMICIYGNHCDLMLDALVYQGVIYNNYYLWYGQGGKETVSSYVLEDLIPYERALVKPEDVIPKKHLDWLKSRPMYYETDKYFFVHAGLVPGMTIEKHKDDVQNGNSETKLTLIQEMLWTRDRFIDSKYDWGKKVIFGHTTMKKPFIMDNKIGIDGMFHNHGQLIAVELPEEKFYFQGSRD